MEKFVCLVILSFFLFSCSKKEISNLPFEVNHNLTCNDLYDNGFKRVFGIDVLMLGKKMNDTKIHFQVTEDFDEVDYEEINNEYEEEIAEPIYEKGIYDKYLEMDALELNDSIYELV